MTSPRRLTSHPTFVALAIGGLVLAGGIALIVVLSGSDGTATTGNSPAGNRVTATRSSSLSTTAATGRGAATTTPTITPTPSTPPRSTPAKTTPKPTKSAAKKPITYVVKRGDNLTVIATWFHQHGYGALYEQNKAVIGDNPNLIFPGQRLTIAGGKMTVSG